MVSKEYEQLKNEYKEHYKKLNEMKQKLMQAKHTQRIAQALEDMDPNPVIKSVDEMVELIREKVAQWEAKLSVALSDTYENFTSSNEDAEKVSKFEQMQKKQDVKETIHEIKLQMEHLNKDVAKESIPNAEKTLGNHSDSSAQSQLKDIMDIENVKKTLGRKK